MSLVTSARPSASTGVEALTVSHNNEKSESGSKALPKSVSDNENRLGDPFLEDFYSNNLTDGHDLLNEPGSFKSPIQLVDVCKSKISPSQPSSVGV
jgi:hypothetical protein